MPAFSTDVGFTNQFAGIAANRVKGALARGYATHAALVAAASAERENIAAGSPQWITGLPLYVEGEPTNRVWTNTGSAATSHAAKVVLGGAEATLGGALTPNEALSVIGLASAPTAGDGAVGQVAVFNSALYLKTGVSTWSAPFPGFGQERAIKVSSYGVKSGDDITAALRQAAADAKAQQVGVDLDIYGGIVSSRIFWPFEVPLIGSAIQLGFCRIISTITNGTETIVVGKGDHWVCRDIWISSGGVANLNTVGMALGGFKFWAAGIPLIQDEIVVSNNIAYMVTTGGVTGTTAPTGTGDGIANGTCTLSTNGFTTTNFAPRLYRGVFTPAVGELRCARGRYYRAIAVTGPTSGTAPTHGSGTAIDGGVTWRIIPNMANIMQCPRVDIRVKLDNLQMAGSFMAWQGDLNIYTDRCAIGPIIHQLHASTLSLSADANGIPYEIYGCHTTNITRGNTQGLAGTQLQPGYIDDCHLVTGNIYTETAESTLAFPMVLVGGTEAVYNCEWRVSGSGLAGRRPYIRFDNVRGGYCRTDFWGTGSPVSAEKTSNAKNFQIYRSAIDSYLEANLQTVVNWWPNPFCEVLQGPDAIIGPGRETITVDQTNQLVGPGCWVVTATPGANAANYRLARLSRSWLMTKLAGKTVTLAALVMPSGAIDTVSTIANLGWAVNGGAFTLGSFVLVSGRWNVHGFVLTLPSTLTSLDFYMFARASGATAGAGETLTTQAIYLVEGDQMPYLRENPLEVVSGNKDWTGGRGVTSTVVDALTVTANTGIQFNVGDQVIETTSRAVRICTTAGPANAAVFSNLVVP